MIDMSHEQSSEVVETSKEEEELTSRLSEQRTNTFECFKIQWYLSFVPSFLPLLLLLLLFVSILYLNPHNTNHTHTHTPPPTNHTTSFK